MPGEEPLLGGDRLEDVRGEVARHLEVDPVVDLGGLDQPALAALGGAFGGAPFGAAAEGVEELAGKPGAEGLGIEVSEQVGSYLQPFDAVELVGLEGEARLG